MTEHRYNIENKDFRISTCNCTRLEILTIVDKEEKVISHISSKRLLELIRSTYN